MFMDSFFQREGIQMQIERAGCVVSTSVALPNHEKATGRAYIGFPPGTDIQVGDVAINPGGDRFCISSVEHSYFKGQLQQLKAFYLTESERAAQQASAVFNIENAYGSVIGFGNTATIHYTQTISAMRQRAAEENTPDRAQIEHLIDLVEMLVNDQIPAQKGLLSRFSALMERHSWLSGAIASTLLSWLR